MLLQVVNEYQVSHICDNTMCSLYMSLHCIYDNMMKLMHKVVPPYLSAVSPSTNILLKESTV